MTGAIYGTLGFEDGRVVAKAMRAGELLERMEVEGLTEAQADAVQRLATMWALTVKASAQPAVAVDVVVEANRTLLLQRSQVGLGNAGTHGGTLVNCVENGAHTVAVRVEKDGKPIAQAQALGLSPDQARAVHQLAMLYAASQGDPDRLEDAVRECLDMYSGVAP